MISALRGTIVRLVRYGHVFDCRGISTCRIVVISQPKSSCCSHLFFLPIYLKILQLDHAVWFVKQTWNHFVVQNHVGTMFIPDRVLTYKNKTHTYYKYVVHIFVYFWVTYATVCFKIQKQWLCCKTILNNFRNIK